MITIVSDERCMEYMSPGHPERPARIRGTLQKLREQSELQISWTQPHAIDNRMLLQAHSEHLLTKVDEETSFDGDTPSYPKIGDHARRSVGGAIAAMQAAKKGSPAFSLLRPPGHHATQDRAMGFCYFNSIAVSVLQAVQEKKEIVAVFDFDVHHGNGTEAILLNHPQVYFASIHQHPCYPGTGTRDLGKNIFNYPVPPRTDRKEYRKVMERAWKRLLEQKPTLLAVSAGFDAYARDPLADETLEADDYHWLGEQIRKTGIPAFSVLEGGYSDDLPELIFAYLKGIEGLT